MKRRNILLNETELALALKNMYAVGITNIEFKILETKVLKRLGISDNYTWFDVEYECTDEQEDNWYFSWIPPEDTDDMYI